MKHKSPDYKLSAVNYYLNHDVGYDNTCKIFDCKKSSLKRWIHKYKTSKNLTRKNRKSVSYKITKPQVNTALELLKQNEQLTMNELAIDTHIDCDNDTYEKVKKEMSEFHSMEKGVTTLFSFRSYEFR